MPESPVKPEKPETPELDRMLTFGQSGQATVIQEFIDWLNANGYVITQRCSDHLVQVHDFEALMREFFGIDSGKVETERRAILAYMAELNRRDGHA